MDLTDKHESLMFTSRQTQCTLRGYRTKYHLEEIYIFYHEHTQKSWYKHGLQKTQRWTKIKGQGRNMDRRNEVKKRLNTSLG